MTLRGDDAALRAFEALGQHAHLAELVAQTQRVARGMVETRRASFAGDGKSTSKLTPEETQTPSGDALAVLDRGPENGEERALAAALYAHAVAESWTEDSKNADAVRRAAADILWLGARTPFDATPLIDRALGEEAPALWGAIAEIVRGVDGAGVPELGRGEALLGCVALTASVSSPGLAASLRDELHDPTLLRALPAAEATAVVAMPAGAEGHLRGELVPAPRGWVATTALALSGILFVFHGARLLARLALAYRCPAEVVLSAEGVRVDARVEMLGRTLREKSTVIGRDALMRAVRDVRYPRIGFYAGLLSLAIGTYFGVSTAVDGVRAASPSLLMVGLICVVAGIGLDFLFSSIAPGAQGQCRVLFVPQKGPALCIGSVDIASADGALGTIVPRV